MKIDFSVSELEIIFQNLPMVKRFESEKRIEFIQNKIDFNEEELKAYIDEYRHLRHKVFKAISDKDGD